MSQLTQEAERDAYLASVCASEPEDFEYPTKKNSEVPRSGDPHSFEIENEFHPNESDSYQGELFDGIDDNNSANLDEWIAKAADAVETVFDGAEK